MGHSGFSGGAFRSLSCGNYRIYWISMCLSSMAIWMQNTVQPWLAYSMTDSPFLLGTVSAVQFMPLLLLSPFAGALIDRAPKRALLLITQAGFMLNALTMASVVFWGRVSFGLVLLVAFLTGMINVVNLPLRQAWISSLVDRDMVVNAVALYVTAFNLARVAGPAAAGFMMDGVGLGGCYLINAGLFFCALVGLAFVRPVAPERKKPASLREIRGDLISGFGYVRRRPEILTVLLILAVTGIFSINYSVLLPVLAIEVLGMGEMGYGSLMSVVGIGSCLGAIAVAARSQEGPRGFFLYASPALLAAMWMVLPACSGPAAYLGLAAIGFFYISCSSTANAALQSWCEPEYLGRVVSFYTLVTAGTSPIGNLFSGTVCDFFGVRAGMFCCGAAACLGLMIIRLAGPGTKGRPAA